MAHAYVIQTVDPANILGPKVEVRIEEALVNRLYKYKPTKFMNLFTVHQVLSNPKRIFIGVRRAFTQDGWCYVGKPATWYVREEVRVPFPRDLVFAVYVDSDRVVYDFIAEDADRKDPLNPVDWENRFGGVIHV